jgi:hypothetical protein
VSAYSDVAEIVIADLPDIEDGRQAVEYTAPADSVYYLASE